MFPAQASVSSVAGEEAVPTPLEVPVDGGVVAGEEITIDAILGMWSKVLGDRPDSAECDFYELGGDSLTALDLVSTIEDRYGVVLQVEDVFEHPTPAQLSDLINTRLGTVT